MARNPRPNGGSGRSDGDGDGSAEQEPGRSRSSRRRARARAKQQADRAAGGAAVAEGGFKRGPVEDAGNGSGSGALNGAAAGAGAANAIGTPLTEDQNVLLGDLFAVIEEHADGAAEAIERALVARAFAFACERHTAQRRLSGEEFIIHPVSVAKICAGMRLDTATLCAALLHDTVEDTSASLEEVEAAFGEEVATLVDGVTKLTG
ncbi:MAG: HD domain-containing protein, partial [Thermoleophilaceae bacterium]